jgi:hypothetical protein
MIGLRLAIVLLAALALSGSVARATSPNGTREVPVPSLEPAKTAAEWRALTRERPRARTAQAACRPLRAVFYAASDWLRLATKLRASGSPCAEYYISVPPIVADKTTFRRDQARRIRALGPNFHALAEVHFTTWNRWVASTGSSWHTAGVTARQRMAEAGYDVALGDSWMLNELNSAVRRGDGNARANVREFLRGLYEGDGRRPTKGAVLVIGFGQRTSNVSVYQSTLQAWLVDSAFWTDMSTYVADWSQEVYGDLRTHAVPGSPTLVRREYLNDYLQHHLVLAGAGPPEIETALAYLREAYSPLANGAWPRESAWGWTMVPAEQMAAYLSAQMDALRSFSAAAGQARDHWGFAWAPSNTTGMPAGDFAAQTGSLLDRLAAAIRDSGAADPESPGGACGADGSLCAVDLADARHNDAWRSFRAWAQSILSLGPVSPISLVAGVASGPLELSVSSAVTRPVSVTLRSSSPGGGFSTSPAGPWTATLSLSVVPGAPVAFYHRDMRAGSATVTAAAPGITPATRPVSVAAGVAARVAVEPGSRSLRARGEVRFTGRATDAFGNPTASALSWTVSPAGLGTFVRDSGGTVRFRAGRVVGSGTVSARAGSLLGSATVVVRPATLRVRALEVRSTARGALVTLAALDGARRPVSLANVTLVAHRGDGRVARAQGTTGAAGKARLRLALGRGCVSLAVTRAGAQGFRWDGRSPRIRLCRR